MCRAPTLQLPSELVDIGAMGRISSNAKQLGCFCTDFCKGLNHWQHGYSVHLVLCSHPIYQPPLSQPSPAHEHPSTMGGAPPGHPISHSPGGQDTAGRRGLHSCLGEGICLLERKNVLENDEGKQDDTNNHTEPSSLWSILPLPISRPDYY